VAFGDSFSLDLEGDGILTFDRSKDPDTLGVVLSDGKGSVNR